MKIETSDLLELVRTQLGVDAVEPDSRFQEDLDAESADVLNIVAAAEDRWGITIGEEEMAGLTTVADLLELVRQRANDA